MNKTFYVKSEFQDPRKYVKFEWMQSKRFLLKDYYKKILIDSKNDSINDGRTTIAYTGSSDEGWHLCVGVHVIKKSKDSLISKKINMRNWFIGYEYDTGNIINHSYFSNGKQRIRFICVEGGNLNEYVGKYSYDTNNAAESMYNIVYLRMKQVADAYDASMKL